MAVEALLTSAHEVGGAQVLASAVEGVAGQELLDLADRLKARLGDAAVLLGSAGAEKVDLVASVSPALVERGVRASEIVRAAAAKVGGGSGGRDDAARGGRPRYSPPARGDRRRAGRDRSRPGVVSCGPAVPRSCKTGIRIYDSRHWMERNR